VAARVFCGVFARRRVSDGFAWWIYAFSAPARGHILRSIIWSIYVMSKMCHAVESEEASMDEIHNVPTCSDSCWENCAHGNKLSVASGEMERLSTQTSPCVTPYGTPIFSRASSFSSFASCFSRFGMFFVQYSLITEILTLLSLLLFALLV
jgi:hypothetical protein